MESLVFIVVILAGLLHASWNLIVKYHQDKISAMGGVMFFQGLMGLSMVLSTEIFPAVIPTIFSSGGASGDTAGTFLKEVGHLLLLSILFHSGYNLFLAQSYRFSDLSLVYPIARGLAPLIVSIIAITYLNDPITPAKPFGILLISLGVMSLGMSRLSRSPQSGLAKPRSGAAPSKSKAFALILITTFFISSYTLTDATGVLKSGDVFSFIGLSLFGSGSITLLGSILYRKREFFSGFKKHFLSWAMAGFMSAAAYMLVMWAVTRSSISSTIALREVGIIFAVIYGVVFFKEKVTPFHLLACLMIVVGVVLLKQ